jgi:hypothetical protein
MGYQAHPAEGDPLPIVQDPIYFYWRPVLMDVFDV